MCRLVAYAGAPTSVAPLVFGGSHSLYRQSWAPRELRSGSVNVDGYGVAWWNGPDEDSPGLLRRAEPIWYDPDLEPLLTRQTGVVVQATLRNATPGLPIDRTGVLPLVSDGWGFSLNGWVPSFRERHMRALRTQLSDRLYARLRGVSDAETLFLVTLQALLDGADPLVALRQAVELVRRRLSEAEAAPLTLVLSRGSGVHLLHTSVGDSPCNSLYVGRESPLAPHGVVVASEPLDDSPWEPVPPHSALHLTPDEGPTMVRVAEE